MITVTYTVDHYANECGVETVLQGQSRYLRIGHALGYQDYSYGNAGNDVAGEPAKIYGEASVRIVMMGYGNQLTVTADPSCDGKEAGEVVDALEDMESH